MRVTDRRVGHGSYGCLASTDVMWQKLGYVPRGDWDEVGNQCHVPCIRKGPAKAWCGAHGAPDADETGSHFHAGVQLKLPTRVSVEMSRSSYMCLIVTKTLKSQNDTATWSRCKVVLERCRQVAPSQCRLFRYTESKSHLNTTKCRAYFAANISQVKSARRGNPYSHRSILIEVHSLLPCFSEYIRGVNLPILAGPSPLPPGFEPSATSQKICSCRSSLLPFLNFNSETCGKTTPTYHITSPQTYHPTFSLLLILHLRPVTHFSEQANNKPPA